MLAIGIGVISTPGTASASEYSKSAPHFDRLMMLRVAMAYNLSGKKYNLSFPATSKNACQIAGAGTVTFVGKDHLAWLNGPEDSSAYDESIQAVLGSGPHFFCTWLLSEAANEAVPGVAKVWEGATMKRNFQRLRKGLRRADCKAVDRALDRYPSVDLPPDRVRNKVVAVMTRPCTTNASRLERPPRS